MPFILSIYHTFIHAGINISPIVRNANYLDWVFFFMLFAMILITVAKLISNYRFQIILQSSFSLVALKQFSNENTTFFHGTSLLLLISSSFIYGILFALIYQYLGVDILPTIPIYLVSVAFTFLILFFWGVKDFFIIAIGHLFDKKEYSHFFIFNKFSLNITISILILLFSFLFFAYKEGIYLEISVIILIASFLARIIRVLIFMIKSRSFSLSYFILYLCILEIIPVLIIYKLISSYLM